MTFVDGCCNENKQQQSSNDEMETQEEDISPMYYINNDVTKNVFDWLKSIFYQSKASPVT
jgi:hypothetical protein